MITTANLTMSYILDRVPQEKVMERYTRVVVNEYSLLGNSFNSPFRVDDNPTCNYYYTDKGKLRFRDWSGPKRTIKYDADCFDVAGMAYKLNCRIPKQFNLVLKLIARDFGLHNFSEQNENFIEESSRLDKYYNNFKKTLSENSKVYKVIPRKPNNYDLQYWGQFNINADLLKKAYIYCVKELWKIVNDEWKLIYKYNSSNPCYGYYNGKTPDKVGIWKFYYPFAKKPHPRFMQNYPAYFGKHLWTNSEIGLITKAYKDAISIYSFGYEIDVLPLIAEGVAPDKQTMYDFTQRHNLNFILLDFDYTGIRMANKLRKDYNVIPLFLTNGSFNTIDYGAKDFSDFVKYYGIEPAYDLLNSVLLYYREQLEHINNLNYHTLKWIYL